MRKRNNSHHHFRHLLQSLFLFFGFIVIGIFLNAATQKNLSTQGASQGTGLIVVSGTAGSYIIPIELDGFDQTTGAPVNSQILNLEVTNSAPITCDYFTATPDTIFPPAKSQLKWSCPGSTMCSISADTGTSPGPVVAPVGSTPVAPANTTRYTLNCDNGIFSATVTTRVKTALPSVKEVLP